ncbi:phosphoribosylamine--glycine ligase [Candidatus Nitrosopelagicus brevis]|uniref:Phosphoribosylamine--glycine ligase n=1 Tax=Candidatus Nitrosopelagicus brevis TaxID=1410606 RepID=A0A0A7V0X6_9ARCH|nr:phosphoribosylamine--glycine ligase [Candidatus Nitrosopelagicus brevis]AJA92662.1 phosphoribosylamine--glycine ligase [Candidatus Nitrosopelagicus brevis]PTL88157.1 phosphoribosylamine--glycine ligase [Candidatus Nitrosopelagicus brevis]
MVNVLVVGAGGREHALSWKLSTSEKIDQVYAAPGNGGTLQNVELSVTDIEGLAKFAQEKNCFTVVGPEDPLATGIVDAFVEKGLPIFGPTKNAAKLESSKIWAKEFMKRNSIPTADFEIFDDAQKAKDFVKSYEKPVVIKADGLAAGKGVIVCKNKDEANDAIDTILIKKSFGDAGSKIIIEERIDGVEASYIALCDGKIGIPMATSQDHKRVFDNDEGPNTGGMGAYSPTPIIDEKLGTEIQEKIIDKTIHAMRDEGFEFKGFLYAGIMIKDGIPYVLEYNVRMGDPECQPILMRLDSDLYDYLHASYEGKLNELPEISWKNQYSVCVVLASKGYPSSYPTGDEITGFENISSDAFVFHAGTKKQDDKIKSNGGRVLGVTALGSSLQDAINNAYDACNHIHWTNKYHRTDIGKKGLSNL